MAADKGLHKMQPNKNGKVRLKRKLPDGVALPATVIPDCVMRLLARHNQGDLSEESMGKLRLYDARRLLRRYRLIPQATKQAKSKVAAEERRMRALAYHKEWRQRQRLKFTWEPEAPVAAQIPQAPQMPQIPQAPVMCAGNI